MTPYDWIVRHLLPHVEFHQNRYARELDGAVLPGCRWLDIGAGGRVHGGWRAPGACAAAISPPASWRQTRTSG